MLSIIHDRSGIRCCRHRPISQDRGNIAMVAAGLRRSQNRLEPICCGGRVTDMDEINVIVIDRGRKHLYLRYTDPLTEKNVEKSSGTANRKRAQKLAGEWQQR